MAPRVLIIDDDRLVLEQAKLALTRAGFEVIATMDPALPEGVDGQSIDLVLLDINMPGFFGDDLVAVLPDLGVRAPIYLYSSISEAELRQRSRIAGAQGYISKRLTYAQMAEEVLAIMASRQSR